MIKELNAPTELIAPMEDFWEQLGQLNVSCEKGVTTTTSCDQGSQD